MFDLKILLRLTRVNDYSLQLVLTFLLIFIISPQNLFSYKTIIIFLANFTLIAFIYVINDVEDAEDDYHNLNKRKRNPIANGELTKKQGCLIGLLLVLVGLFLLLLISHLVFFVGLVLTLIGFLYSWKPVRLKSIPIIDLISHIICLGVLQFFIIYLTFRHFDLFIIPFLMIIIPISLMTEIFGELRDFDVDKKSKINNTIQNFGRFNIKKLLIISSVAVITGFITILFTIPSEYKIIALLVSVFIGIMVINRMNTIFKGYTSLQY